MPYTPTQQLTFDVLQWPGTSVRLGSRGEYGFDARGVELGHLHGDRVAHFFFDRRLGTELHEAGRVGPHPVAPQSIKMGARAIESADDVADIRAMMRLNYERPARKVIEQVERAAGDVDALAELLTESATVVNDAGKRVVGREDFRQTVTAARSAGAPIPNVILTFDSADFLSTDLAIVRATRRPADADDPLAPALLTLTIVRDAKVWLIEAMQTTPLVAPRVPAAA